MEVCRPEFWVMYALLSADGSYQGQTLLIICFTFATLFSTKPILRESECTAVLSLFPWGYTVETVLSVPTYRGAAAP